MIFHPLNVRNITKLNLKNGNRICNRFHSLGSCFTDCRNSEGHVRLDKEEAADYVKFVQAARAARASFQQKQFTKGDTSKKEANEEPQEKDPIEGPKAGA